MKAYFNFNDKETQTYTPHVTVEGNLTTVRIPRYDMLNMGIATVDIDTGLFHAKAGDEGYYFSSGGIGSNTVLTYFTHRDDICYQNDGAVMPIMGMSRNGDGKFLIAEGMGIDFRAYYTLENDCYNMIARFILEEDNPYEDIVLLIYDMPGADYNDMAHVYREYQYRTKGLKSYKERAKNKPALAYAAEAPEIRIRQGWKPAPSPVRHQNAENEPPIKVVCDFDRVCDIIDEMQLQGIKKAELCLVGWNRGGHDGRFPQLFPAEPAFGGDEGLDKLIRKAKNAGYKIVCHDNYTAAYECADCWDEEYVAKFKDGRLASRHYDGPPLSGGQPYLMCAQRAYERFAIERLPKYKEVGFSGLHFIDVFSAITARKCYDINHPNNSADCRDYFLKIMKLASENIGGFQSEGPFDFVAQELDSCMYTTMAFRLKGVKVPIWDEEIPFWELVYHGTILSNPSSETVNYTIKDMDKKIRLMEYAGRPLMYFYSRFVSEDSKENKKYKFENWMGKKDLACGTDEELRESVKAIKQACDDYESIKHLQYEFMEKHEILAKGKYRTTFSDGTKITADYNTNEYVIEKGDK